MAYPILTTYPLYTGRDGIALEGGMLWFGEVNKDPISNPVAVYLDQNKTIPAVQPIRTTAGVPYYNGTPTNIYIDGDFSLLVNDKNGARVYYAKTSSSYQFIKSTFVSQQDIQNNSFNTADAGGNVNEITATFTPDVTILTNGMSFWVRSLGPNDGAETTFSPGTEMVPKTVVLQENKSLYKGATGGEGYWMYLKYDDTYDKWVLVNPKSFSASSSTIELPTEDIGPFFSEFYGSMMTWRTIGDYTGYASIVLGTETYYGSTGSLPNGFIEQIYGEPGKVPVEQYKALTAWAKLSGRLATDNSDYVYSYNDKFWVDSDFLYFGRTRGLFIRVFDNGESGSNYDSDRNSLPNKGWATIQNTSNLAHNHNLGPTSNTDVGGGAPTTGNADGAPDVNTESSGGHESRPYNIVRRSLIHF